tara:strand:+ start:141157 stop:142020 length:864 start_codon:yes stop_codon:yes gene_type:complete
MKNIIVSTDLTINCDRALERAIKIAKSSGAKLHVVHVAPIYLLPGKVSETETLKQDKEELIRSHLSSYAGAEALKPTIHVIEGGNAFAEIIAISKKLNADLIVMGLHNKLGFRDMFIGTTVERVIRKGLKPVLMVKDKPKGDYGRVVAGCDFSDSARKSFNFALKLAPRAHIDLVHSYDFADTLTGQKIETYAGDIIEGMEKKQLDKFVKESADVLTKYKVSDTKFSHKIVKGSPQVVLAEEVKKEHADLLAIGVNSRAGFAHSKLGGVAEDILANPPCDVLITSGL